MVSLDFSDKDIDRVREAYVAHVEAVDDELGRVLDAVPDDTALFVLGDHGLALGEHGYMGRAAPTSHRLSYEIPYLIRHPDGQNAGDHIAWYASTHDVAPTALSFLGLPIPGKMDGEDLTALFDDVDQWDLPKREKVITAVGSQIVIRDNRWLVVADRQRTIRRMYDDDEEGGAAGERSARDRVGIASGTGARLAVAASERVGEKHRRDLRREGGARACDGHRRVRKRGERRCGEQADTRLQRPHRGSSLVGVHEPGVTGAGHPTVFALFSKRKT